MLKQINNSSTNEYFFDELNELLHKDGMQSYMKSTESYEKYKETSRMKRSFTVDALKKSINLTATDTFPKISDNKNDKSKYRIFFFC